MKKYEPKLKFDDYQYPYVEMVESKQGKYVLAEEAFEENVDYEYDIKVGDWVKIGNQVKEVNMKKIDITNVKKVALDQIKAQLKSNFGLNLHEFDEDERDEDFETEMYDWFYCQA